MSRPRRLATWIVPILALVVLATVPRPTRGGGIQSLAGTIEEHRVDAPSLAHNLIGDDARKRVLVYLPPGYSESGDRYPVLYLLHGIFDAPETWTQGLNARQNFDAAVVAGRFPPAILVMPSGGNRVGGGYYRDSPVTGNWGTFVAEELVGWVDAMFRTLPRRENRGVAGHSMGGYGALHLAMEHPDVFSAAYGLSPCCLAPVGDLGQSNAVWQAVAGVRGWEAVDSAIATRTISGLYMAALPGVSMAFADDTSDGPFHTELPFAVRSGQTVVNGPEHAEWVEAFPVHRVDDKAAALRSLSGLAFDYGIDEQFDHIPTGARLFAEALAEHRIPFELEVYRGDHRNRVAQRFVSEVLPFLMERVAGH